MSVPPAMPPVSSAAATMTDIILEVFRLNGLLAAYGDALSAPFGLTSARWKVIGAIALEGRPITVAQIARRMGLTRQAVQRLADEMASDGLVRRQENPDHVRAPLIALTQSGAASYAAVSNGYADASERLSAGMSDADLATTLSVVRMLVARLSQG
jgi:DNA-binding MarR family transcriptional regulator